MGKLIDGRWHTVWYDTTKTGGHFVRKASSFRGHLGGSGPLPIEAGRYHLTVSWACPWAHRALVFRVIKGLTAAIPISTVEPLMLDNGWEFSERRPDGGSDAQPPPRFLYEVYQRADPTYTGRVTVPILRELASGRIVNNESSEIIRMLNRGWEGIADTSAPFATHDFHPDALHEAIAEVNERVYHTVNNGVYKAGFATKQAAYDQAVSALFDSLDWLEARLRNQPWLAGGVLTEADIRLFTTLVRFDAVYHGHFKCNRARLTDYPELWDLTRAIARIPGVWETCRMEEIKAHYYASHTTINPYGIIAAGPDLDYLAPTKRVAAST